MKKIISLSFFASVWLIAGNNYLQAQELYQVSNTSLQEEMLKPAYHYEYIPDFTYSEVAERVRQMETDMPFELNERVFSFINYFVVRNREYTKMVLQRKEIYFPMFEEVLAYHNMPDDIKFLSIIESGLNPKAKSRVGAMGLWQFMPATGRMYNMQANADIDDRMDPEMSTDAAAKYLKSLYRMFNDWEVALAAYNCGPGNVRKAIRRSGGKTTFWGIYDQLPKETRSYVPQFQAMMYILRYADEHNLVLEEPTYPIAFEKVKFNQALDLDQLSSLSGICIEDLEHLNPSIQHRLIPSSHQHIALRVPKSKVEYITANKKDFSDAIQLKSDRAVELRVQSNVAKAGSSTNTTSTVGKERVAYKVKSGDVLGKIAQMHGTTVDNIKSWNNLSSNIIRVGQTIYVYTNNASPTTTASGNVALATSSQGDQTLYTVQPGDSLWLISKKLNGISVEEIKRLNNLNTNQIKPGQKLIIG